MQISVDLSTLNNRIPNGNYNFTIKELNYEKSPTGVEYFPTKLAIESKHKIINIILFGVDLGALYSLQKYGFIKYNKIDINISELLGYSFNADLLTKTSQKGDKIYNNYVVKNFKLIKGIPIKEPINEMNGSGEDDIPFYDIRL